MDERRRARTERCERRRRAGRRAAAVVVVLVVLAVGAGGCRSAGPPPAVDGALPILGAPPFAVGLQPTRAAAARIGEPVGLRLSSSEAGYGNLYLINVDGSVMALAENLPLAPGVDAAYPRPGDGFELRASPPAGVERLILLVTLQPFAGLGDVRAGSRSRVPVAARRGRRGRRVRERARPGRPRPSRGLVGAPRRPSCRSSTDVVAAAERPPAVGGRGTDALCAPDPTVERAASRLFGQCAGYGACGDGGRHADDEPRCAGGGRSPRSCCRRRWSVAWGGGVARPERERGASGWTPDHTSSTAWSDVLCALNASPPAASRSRLPHQRIGRTATQCRSATAWSSASGPTPSGYVTVWSRDAET